MSVARLFSPAARRLSAPRRGTSDRPSARGSKAMRLPSSVEGRSGTDRLSHFDGAGNEIPHSSMTRF